MYINKKLFNKKLNIFDINSNNYHILSYIYLIVL